MELDKVQLLNKGSILQPNSIVRKEQDILSTTTTELCNQQVINKEDNYINTLVERRKGTQLYLKNNNNNHNHNDNPTSTPQSTNNYSTNSILAQIERQNALLEKDPKSISIASNALKCHFSTAQKLVSDCHSPPPSAPPFFNSHNDSNKDNNIHHHHLNNYQRNKNNNNDWDFWQSLLQDPVHMTQKTPHLLSMKLRSGIPSHVRGHIWQTICQSDSLHLETVYGQLCNEHSPHERIIQRDLTRTFPTIDMFQQENGDGQLAMRRILIAYSLYDGDVGYCQGLAFLVGPLLMNMPETSAFCVFVRLMETYEMRTMFTLNMEGLQLRLYQFSCLLKEFLPKLSAHFEHHSIHAAMYASQWFLTLFAYAFPMDLVTRIYDIIFLEGAAETIMRVAIAMLQRSEHIILQEQEFEHLLDCVTTRKLCAPYNENWSLVIQETMSLSNVITKEKLNSLTDQYNQQGQQEKKKTEQVLASRLGNFWRRNRSTRRNNSNSNNNNNNNNNKKGANHPDRSSIAGPIHSIKKKKSNDHNVEKEKEEKGFTTNELKTKKSRYSLPIDPSQLPTNFDIPPIPMTSSHQSTTTEITTTHKEFDSEAVIHELLQALEELRKEHSKTIDELFEIKMDKQDIESERDALKLTIVELERRYYTQQRSIYNNNNNDDDDQNNTVCSQHKITTTKKSPLLDQSPSPCSPLPQSDINHDCLPLTYISDMIHPNNNDENEDDDDQENASTSTLSLSTNRTAATTINDDDDDDDNGEDMKAENEFLRSELVKIKVDNFEKQQYCEKLEQEVDNLQSRLDMMNEGQLNLADKLVAMKSDMDELLQKMKQRELSWNDLKKENEDLTQKIIKLNQHQSSITNCTLEEQQQCHNTSELLLLDDGDNKDQPDNLTLSTIKEEQDKIHDHSFVNNNNNNNTNSSSNNNALGKSGSLYGRMWHALSPKSHSLKISQ
ncbi:rab-GTPase-TBC domain-containing protein [Cunninghamella echinulata]|nr:rab-GTPase-TBC domain-containing protein [Cunninghamella echinulata]